MQLSLMIEPVEVDNLQITVSQGIKSPYLLMIETVEVLITCIPRRMKSGIVIVTICRGIQVIKTSTVSIINKYGDLIP